ncbi:hypothetical protein MTP04_17040 [Lysinibacillus sp. PLM2]|nr:hypothetical protein MTP04_17040 [Lysinibacillus sp. PLM2]
MGLNLHENSYDIPPSMLVGVITPLILFLKSKRICMTEDGIEFIDYFTDEFSN